MKYIKGGLLRNKAINPPESRTKILVNDCEKVRTVVELTIKLSAAHLLHLHLLILNWYEQTKIRGSKPNNTSHCPKVVQWRCTRFNKKQDTKELGFSHMLVETFKSDTKYTIKCRKIHNCI